MDLDIQSLFGLLCTSVLIGREQATTPHPPHLGLYARALLVSQGRRHLFVTTCSYRMKCDLWKFGNIKLENLQKTHKYISVFYTNCQWHYALSRHGNENARNPPPPPLPLAIPIGCNKTQSQWLIHMFAILQNYLSSLFILPRGLAV